MIKPLLDPLQQKHFGELNAKLKELGISPYKMQDGVWVLKDAVEIIQEVSRKFIMDNEQKLPQTPPWKTPKKGYNRFPKNVNKGAHLNSNAKGARKW